MKAPRIALSILGLIFSLTVIGCENPCSTDQRQLEVTNNSSGDIWIGGGGGALRAICIISPTESCIPPDGHYKPDGTCNCGSGQFDAILACPGISSPKLGFAEGGKECGCYQDSDCGPGAGCNPNRHLCFYLLPEPAPFGFTPKTNPWQVPPGGTVNFCLDPGSVTYPTPASQPSPATAARAGVRQVRHRVLDVTPTATPTPAQIPSAVWWSGGVFARTGCNDDGTQCASGECFAKPNSNCPAGVGGKNPASLAEFTFQRSANDFYDISIINGANIAEQMAPIATATQSPGPVSESYWCRPPGSACNWDFAQYIAKIPVLPTPTPTPSGSMAGLSDPSAEPAAGAEPAANYATVDYTTLLMDSVHQCQTDSNPDGCPAPLTCSGTNGRCYKKCTTDADCTSSGKGAATLHCLPGGNPIDDNGTKNSYCQCSDDVDCSNGEFCGTQQIPGVGPGETYLQVCGTFRGWWTVDDLCATPANHVGPLDCSASILDGDFKSTTNLSALMGCNALGEAKSCYQIGARQTCCGCATDSSNPLVKLWPSDSTMTCYGNNPTWASVAQPLLANLKQACPAAYSYPFDDATSTFQCHGADAINALGYKITFADLPEPPPSFRMNRK